MWNHAKLLELAAAQEKAFLDARMDVLYYAMCRYNGSLLERPVGPDQVRRELDAALDALTVADIRRHMMAPFPPDSIYEQMLALKQTRLAELAPTRSQAPTTTAQTEDSEPEQSQ